MAKIPPGGGGCIAIPRTIRSMFLNAGVLNTLNICTDLKTPK